MWVQVTTLEYQGLNEGHKEYAEQWAHSTAYVTPQAVVAVLGTKGNQRRAGQKSRAPRWPDDLGARRTGQSDGAAGSA